MIDVLDLKDEGGAEPCFRINGNISLSKTNRIEDVSLSHSHKTRGKKIAKEQAFCSHGFALYPKLTQKYFVTFSFCVFKLIRNSTTWRKSIRGMAAYFISSPN